MSLGPEKIILILVVALIVFGPQRLPEIARQVGAMVRELRRMQDSVRGELEQVLHPDFTAPDSDGRTLDMGSDSTPSTVPSLEESDHAALPAEFVRPRHVVLAAREHECRDERERERARR